MQSSDIKSMSIQRTKLVVLSLFHEKMLLLKRSAHPPFFKEKSMKTISSRSFFAPTISLVSVTLLTLVGIVVAPNIALADDVPPQDVNVELVDTLTALAKGPHAGFRSNHAKGIMATGFFTPSPKAARLTKASHVNGGNVPVLVRFSNGTGVPTIPDADPNSSPHGMAIRFLLPDNDYTDIVSISYNGFPVATPEDFLSLLKAIQASGPDASKPTPIEQFLGSHPAALQFVNTPKPAPTSFTTLSYFGVNAFKFTNGKGVSRFGRYRIVPLNPEPALRSKQAANMSPDYLMAELPTRLLKREVKFKISVQLANATDAINNGSVVWPESRPQVELGILTLKAIVANSKDEEKKLMFSPLALPDGIAPSNDPVLLSRPAAYAVSYGRRASQ